MAVLAATALPASRDDLEQLQLERLQATLHRVQRHVAFYRSMFADTGFDPERMRSDKPFRNSRSVFTR